MQLVHMTSIANGPTITLLSRVHLVVVQPDIVPKWMSNYSPDNLYNYTVLLPNGETLARTVEELEDAHNILLGVIAPEDTSLKFNAFNRQAIVKFFREVYESMPEEDIAFGVTIHFPMSRCYSTEMHAEWDLVKDDLIQEFGNTSVNLSVYVMEHSDLEIACLPK